MILTNEEAQDQLTFLSRWITFRGWSSNLSSNYFPSRIAQNMLPKVYCFHLVIVWGKKKRTEKNKWLEMYQLWRDAGLIRGRIVVKNCVHI